ncbi:MAG: UvrB/UvrC motif-containing protein [Spirochaetales bacterium]|jgi:protein arginine kinase activator|nr:UvrB/UvrC motif-containing protein [Spirochaetales bacterium]
MMCEICGKDDARIRIRQIIGTECREMRICEECARQRGIIGGEHGLSEDAAWFLHGLFEDIPGRPLGIRSCPVCGTRLRDIRSSRRVGCSHCCETFGTEIRKILRLKEGERVHKGKLPRSILSYKTFFIDRENLKIQLEIALDNEDYEKAAQLRDEILGLDKMSRGTP